MNTILIANPIYDTVFKHLMENNRAARFFVETIIGAPVESITVKQQEVTWFKTTPEILDNTGLTDEDIRKTHDSYIVQIPHIKGKTRTRLEMMLNVFEQQYFVDEEVIITRDKKIAEQQLVIEENAKALKENAKTLEEKDKTIEEKDKALEEKDRMIVEKDKAMEEKNKKLAIKLLMMNEPVEEIIALTELSREQVTALMTAIQSKENPL